ncbi:MULTISPECIES: hypothetical protein [Mesorhizobium]|uniref:Calcium-binding protein n=1 Tax=Mesorhizobium erdmanii TaxID=1777866 RepID=A0A6M7UTU8_9HYPH|nr:MULTISPECIES: hypothetical protein [Mesorhizobium]QKC79373.1 hypothetical protein EB233_31265 [Mesorhizobium erdmanii]
MAETSTIVLHGTPDEDLILDNQNRNDLHSPGDGQRGRPGDEEIVCGDDADYVNGGPGDDSDDFLCGNEGYDFLHGERGNDSLFGGAGKDYLYGEEGDDHPFGGGRRSSVRRRGP